MRSPSSFGNGHLTPKTLIILIGVLIITLTALIMIFTVYLT